MEINTPHRKGHSRGQTEGPFDMPFDKLTVLSKVEGLTALSEAEGLIRREGEGQPLKGYGYVEEVCI